MTFKLWLLSIIISALAPYFLPKAGRQTQEPSGKDNTSYSPGQYPDHSLSALQSDHASTPK